MAVVVRRYLKAEEAHLAASVLGAAGIEATVVDESAFGGNLVGAASGVRLEVDAGDVERAVEVLGVTEAETPAGAEEGEEPGEAPTRTGWFDTLVLAELLLFGSWLVAPGLLAVDLGDWDTVSPLVADLAWVLFWPNLLLAVLSSVLLFLRWRLGRVLFCFTFAWALVAQAIFPLIVVTKLGAFVAALGWTAMGILLTAMWLPPVRDEFTRR